MERYYSARQRIYIYALPHERRLSFPNGGFDVCYANRLLMSLCTSHLITIYLYIYLCISSATSVSLSPVGVEVADVS